MLLFIKALRYGYAMLFLCQLNVVFPRHCIFQLELYLVPRPSHSSGFAVFAFYKQSKTRQWEDPGMRLLQMHL